MSVVKHLLHTGNTICSVHVYQLCASACEYKQEHMPRSLFLMEEDPGAALAERRNSATSLLVIAPRGLPLARPLCLRGRSFEPSAEFAFPDESRTIRAGAACDPISAPIRPAVSASHRHGAVRCATTLRLWIRRAASSRVYV